MSTSVGTVGHTALGAGQVREKTFPNTYLPASWELAAHLAQTTEFAERNLLSRRNCQTEGSRDGAQ